MGTLARQAATVSVHVTIPAPYSGRLARPYTLYGKFQYMKHSIPVLGFAAFSGTGKTTLLTQLIPLLAQRGIRVSVIKHAHHNFDVDRPGKDSYELRKAGARQMLVASARRWALMSENDTVGDPRLDELIKHLDSDSIDMVLVEGFKHVPFTRIELHRPALGHPLLFPEDSNIIAVAADAPVDNCNLPLLDLNNVGAITDFILGWVTPQLAE